MPLYQPGYEPKSLRMEIAIVVMRTLLEKDFKNLSYSARSGSKNCINDYITDEAFTLADAMIEREKKEVQNDDSK